MRQLRTKPMPSAFLHMVIRDVRVVGYPSEKDHEARVKAAKKHYQTKGEVIPDGNA